MLKKNHKQVLTILFFCIFMCSLFIAPNAMKNLCNIDYHPMNFIKILGI